MLKRPVSADSNWNISTRLSNFFYIGYVLVEYDAESATFRNGVMALCSGVWVCERNVT
jgi:hypothetical protein